MNQEEEKLLVQWKLYRNQAKINIATPPHSVFVFSQLRSCSCFKWIFLCLNLYLILFGPGVVFMQFR